MAGVEAYAGCDRVKGWIYNCETNFITRPARWFDEERWKDDLDESEDEYDDRRARERRAQAQEN